MKNYTPTGQLGFTTPCGVEHEPVSEVAQNPADLTAVVSRFRARWMSKIVFASIDEMASQIDELEQILKLRTALAAEGSPLAKSQGQDMLSSFRVRRMSNTIASKVDMMVNRIDELEQILKLRTAVGAEGWDPKSEAVTPGDDPK